MRRRWAWWAVPTGLAAAVGLGPRARLDADAIAVPDVDGDPVSWIAAREAAVDDLRPGGAARVNWHGAPGTRTPWAVVYLHGFSADRAEIAPVPARVAEGLGANLFESRLTGHGRIHPDAMADGTAEAWVADAHAALAVGRRLGERVLVVGTSTGATLAVWLAARGHLDADDAMVLVSPNFHPADPASRLLLAPWGRWLVRAAVGPRRTWTPRTPGQAAHWSHDYPSEVLLEMMALVHAVEGLDLALITAPTLALYHPDDQVVDARVTAARLDDFGRPVRRVILAGGDDPDHHVMAGDILSPSTNGLFVSHILAFVREESSDRPLGSPDGP